ncbi:uncharacterized protein RCO7_09773 [Rhynchosporium graminicola]|uniref:Uncharacterized protein n=1 Tax=Rhynchosporium graminicola TaxID=2792576 RepID=A0A1E1LAY3_9HELO|nr:uncharacterized protein RCO7_09773 [Rhynchosporium commune]
MPNVAINADSTPGTPRPTLAPKAPLDPSAIPRSSKEALKTVKNSPYTDKALLSLFQEQYDGLYTPDENNPAYELAALLHYNWRDLKALWTEDALTETETEEGEGATITVTAAQLSKLREDVKNKAEKEVREDAKKITEKEMLDQLSYEQDEAKILRTKKIFEDRKKRRRSTIFLNKDIEEFDLRSDALLPPVLTPTDKTWGKEISVFTKLYPEEMKFKGDSDSFSSKIRIFRDTCLRAEIPPKAYIKAFPLILKGAALEHYYFNLSSTPGAPLIVDFNSIYRNFIEHFENDEFARASLIKFNFLTLDIVKAENPGRTLSECFDLLTTKVRQLRYSIPIEMPIPQSTLEKTISTLKNYIVTYEHSHPAESFPAGDAFYTDRRFQGNRAEYEGTEEQYLASAFLQCEVTSDNISSDSDGETFITSLGELSASAAQQITQKLANAAFTHPISVSEVLPDNADPETEIEVMMSNPRYNASTFQGIMIDTRAAKVSTVSKGQYEAYKALYKAKLLPSRGISIKFGVGNTSSIGVLIVLSPIGEIQFEVMTTDIPFLLCLDDMDKLKVMLDNLRNVLIIPNGDVPIIRKWGYPFLL